MKKFPPVKRVNNIFESRLTHLGWAIVREGRIINTFRAQVAAEKATIDMAKEAGKVRQTEAHLFKASGKLRVARRYGPLTQETD